jgi:hypothetical protein
MYHKISIDIFMLIIKLFVMADAHKAYGTGFPASQWEVTPAATEEEQ